MVNTERLCMGCMNDNGNEKVCPICGHDNSQDNSAEYLSAGTWLNANRYLVGKVIETNGDSAVYIGWDNDSNAIVHIWEYLPIGLSRRSADRLTVTAAEGKGYEFNRGLDEFMILHTNLSRLEVTTGLLPVIDVFESNGTVYSVCTTVSGITLKDFLIRNGGTLTWEQARPLLMPVLSVLTRLHEAGIVHRGISPETIIVGRDGRLYLTGFSVEKARVLNTEFSAKLAAGYAAPEQYDTEVSTGAACDIYAFGAVIFRCIIGSTPPDAKERLVNDKLSIPANITETVSKGALAAIANALKVDPNARTASADRFKKMLEAAVAAPASAEKAPVAKKKVNDSKKYAIIASGVTAAVFIIILVLVLILSGDLFKGKKPTGSDNSDINLPQQSQVGEVDPNVSAELGEKLYEIPDLKGKTYAEVIQETKLNGRFEVVIAGKQYSDSVARGKICDQTVKAGTSATKDTEIGVYISLGPSTIKMPNLIGKTKDEVHIALLEYGFLPENIEFRERLSATAQPGTVTATSVKAGDSVSLDDAIIVDYCPEKEETTSSEE